MDQQVSTEQVQNTEALEAGNEPKIDNGEENDSGLRNGLRNDNELQNTTPISLEKQVIRVSLTQLRPFSGTLYDENGNPVPVSGNPFSVPEDYLPRVSTSASSASTANASNESADTATDSNADTVATDADTGKETDADADIDNDSAALKGKMKELRAEKIDKDTLSMRSLHASIEQEGVLTPLLVRRAQRTIPSADEAQSQTQTGGTDTEEPIYEILSGYRRKRVCEELSKTRPEFSTVPVIVIEPCDDDTASSIITSSNVQRREVSLLETIKSCGQMYRALRHRGSREHEDLTADVVSQILGLKPRTVRRYSMLLELPEKMLILAGTKAKNEDGVLRLPIGAGEVLAGISGEKLSIIEEVLMDTHNEDMVITVNAAKAIRKAASNSKMTKKQVEGILKKQKQVSEKKKAKNKESGKRLGSAVGGFILDENRIRKFCGDKMTEKEVMELIYDLVEKWSKDK